MASRVKWDDRKLTAAAEGIAKRAILKTCIQMERDIKLSMTRTKKFSFSRPGLLRAGKRGTKGAKYHHVSIPGSPPAVDTGRLRASITYATSWGPKSSPSGDVITAEGVRNPLPSRNRMTGVVGTNVIYGRWLELGTPKMKPRPYLRPALAKNKSLLVKFMAEEKGKIR